MAKVYARVDARNSRSLKIVVKQGITREGVLRSHTERQEKRIDDVYYGILRDEQGCCAHLGAGLGPD